MIGREGEVDTRRSQTDMLEMTQCLRKKWERRNKLVRTEEDGYYADQQAAAAVEHVHRTETYCHGGSLVTRGQPSGDTSNGREFQFPTIQDIIAGFPRTFLGKANQKDISFPFDWTVLHDDVTKDPVRVPASP